jgi:hypothetical protein
MRGARPTRAIALLCLQGCSSYVGNAAVDAAAGGVTDRSPVRDVGPRRDASRCYWDPTWGCDPFDASSCGDASVCVVSEFDSVAPQSECRPAGTRAAGMICSDDAAADRCARGMLCLRGRCVVGCCGGADDARCDARTAGSSCAVPTPSLRVWGCTLPGACDYREGACPTGQVCVPTSVHGNATCAAAGSGGENSPCAADDRCTSSLTCLISFPSSIGRCRPRCNPRAPTAQCLGRCAPFADRPADYGVCEPPA